MNAPEHWSIAERHMVRYHLSHLMWWALGTISALVLVATGVIATTGARVLRPHPVTTIWWYLVLITTPILTGIALVSRDILLHRVRVEWSLYRVVVHYTRAVRVMLMLCLLAGLLPCAVAAVHGQFDYPLLIVVVPLVVLVVQFPHAEKFRRFVEDTLPESA